MVCALQSYLEKVLSQFGRELKEVHATTGVVIKGLSQFFGALDQLGIGGEERSLPSDIEIAVHTEHVFDRNVFIEEVPLLIVQWVSGIHPREYTAKILTCWLFSFTMSTWRTPLFFKSVSLWFTLEVYEICKTSFVSLLPK